VPAGVGIVVAASSVGGQWLAVAASVVVSTLATHGGDGAGAEGHDAAGMGKDEDANV
jgi:putative effector of murein hydrolase LrgA (UPF0299 family)